MNKVFLIGNLTRDPELRTTQSGDAVCNFTLAVNKRVKKGDHPEADYFRVTVWNEKGRNCAQYLAKGKKANVIGEVRLESYADQQGVMRYHMAVKADDVEFLTPKGEATAASGGGYTQVPDEELPEEFRQ